MIRDVDRGMNLSLHHHMNSTYPMATPHQIADLQADFPIRDISGNGRRMMVVEEVDDPRDDPSLCNTAPSDGSLLEGPSFPPSLSRFGEGRIFSFTV